MNRKFIASRIAQLLLAALVAVGCASRSSRMTNTVPGAVITQKAFSYLLSGGICRRNGTSGALERCSSKVEDLKTYLPSAFQMSSAIKRSEDGSGYTLEARWAYQPISIPNSRVDWKIYEDTLGLADPKPEEFQSRIDTIGRFQWANDGEDGYLSDVLLPGKRYIFYWVGETVSSQADAEVLAEMLYFQVVVDLHDVAPVKN